MKKFKNDQYRKIRGGKSQMLRLFCASCNVFLITYQKDGDGALLRCYLNRIFSPATYSGLQNDATIKKPADMPVLECTHCKSLIGTPMLHHDGRLAFRLKIGTFKKIKEKKEVCDG